MLTNSETGRIQCDQCGHDLGEHDPGEADHFGTVYCTRCSGKLDGYQEAWRDSSRELLENTIQFLLDNGRSCEDVAEWSAHAISVEQKRIARIARIEGRD